MFSRLSVLRAFAIIYFLTLTGPLRAQTFNTLHTFSPTSILATNLDGAYPRAGLVLSGSRLYGVTEQGGASGYGTVYAINTDGSDFTNLYSFSAIGAGGTNADGAAPAGPLLLIGGTLYGTASGGGAAGSGTIFKINTDGSGFQTLHSFALVTFQTNRFGNIISFGNDNTDGANPDSALVLVGTTLWGAAGNGGTYGNGTLFSLNMDGSAFTVAYTFTPTTGAYPGTNFDGWNPTGLFLSGGILYGTAGAGGQQGSGTVFSVNPNGSVFQTLYSLTAQGTGTNSDGYYPACGVICSGGMLYGSANVGGTLAIGTLFSLNTDGSSFHAFHDFGAGSPNEPVGSLLLSGATLYGTTTQGGSAGGGSVFKVGIGGAGYTDMHIFTSVSGPASANGDGFRPCCSLVLSGGTLYGTATGGGAWGSGTIYKINTDGSGFATLHTFAARQIPVGVNADGGNPFAGLAVSGTTLYGAASTNGGVGSGTIFKMNTDGSAFSLMHTFSPLVATVPGTNADGAGCRGNPVLSGNTLFGTALYGGSGGEGTVFSLSTVNSNFVLLHTFTSLDPATGTNSDGANPYSGLLLSGGELYGTTEYGGNDGVGAVFKMNTGGGGFVPLHCFSAVDGSYANGDGAFPLGGLAGSSNLLFGTAFYGGVNGDGAVFRMDTNGLNFTNLHSFTAISGAASTNHDGADPFGTLLVSGNVLYGTTSAGGDFGNGAVFRIDNDGMHFTNLHSFTSLGGGSANGDGANPIGGLVLSGATLYGVAQDGGQNGSGTVFAVETGGANFTTLYSFSSAGSGSNSDGAYPTGSLVLSGGALYGTAFGGGMGAGTVFSIMLGTGGRPPLAIVRSGANSILSWPTNPTGYSLQATANLGSSNGWTNVLPGPVVIGGQNVVTNLASDARKFYRLIH